MSDQISENQKKTEELTQKIKRLDDELGALFADSLSRYVEIGLALIELKKTLERGKYLDHCQLQFGYMPSWTAALARLARERDAIPTARKYAEENGLKFPHTVEGTNDCVRAWYQRRAPVLSTSPHGPETPSETRELDGGAEPNSTTKRQPSNPVPVAESFSASSDSGIANARDNPDLAPPTAAEPDSLSIMERPRFNFEEIDPAFAAEYHRVEQELEAAMALYRRNRDQFEAELQRLHAELVYWKQRAETAEARLAELELGHNPEPA